MAVTASDRGTVVSVSTVQVWRLADGTPVGQAVRGHDGMVRAVATGALADGTPVAVTGGTDGAVRVWRLADGTPVGSRCLPTPAGCARWRSGR